jgi:hypothetical protein
MAGKDLDRLAVTTTDFSPQGASLRHLAEHHKGE